LKVDNDLMALIALGKEFHRLGAADANALSPNVTSNLPGGVVYYSNVSSLLRKLHLQGFLTFTMLQI
jgi:hypothetical protein